MKKYRRHIRRGGRLEIEEAGWGEDTRRRKTRREEKHKHNSHTEQNRVQGGTKTHKEQPF